MHFLLLKKKVKKKKLREKKIFVCGEFFSLFGHYLKLETVDSVFCFCDQKKKRDKKKKKNAHERDKTAFSL